MTVSEKDAAGTADYQGVTYHFCSEACRRRFAANPGEFVK